ncbi:hypothetical protein EPN95_04570 [Patescibacteria group bacterium]|nr:MAG: hypothetical protein EPN95_04570 [Patescibacteria group bacterium]
MYEWGPWERKENLDVWSTHTWGPFYGAKWPEEFERPRTCSFCGGANPEDVVRLIEKGWEVQKTDKKYKFYLHPPGYHDYIMSDQTPEGASVPFPSVVPPVKIYTMHIQTEEVWNKIVNW